MSKDGAPRNGSLAPCFSNCSGLALMVAPKEQTNNWSFRDALKKKYGGKWLVLGCEKDEFCSFSALDLNVSEQLQGYYGQAFWSVKKL